MSFDAFLAAIEAPALREVALHWNSARGGKRMPAWGDLDPMAIARQLPIVWSWKYGRATDSFTGRLAGEQINAAFGKHLRGSDMRDFFGANYPKILARHKRVINGPCFAHGRGNVFSHAERYGMGERIIMPLSEDGLLADGIFGATVYRSGSNHHSELGFAIAAETVDFFALD